MSEVAQVWGARIDWQQRSGLTVAECCEAEGVLEYLAHDGPPSLLTTWQTLTATELNRTPGRVGGVQPQG